MIYTCTIHPEWRETSYRGMLDHVHRLHPGDPADYLIQMGYIVLDTKENA